MNLLIAFIPKPEARAKLAAIINRRADEGSVEVYRSLLPLIMDAYIDESLLLLDKKVVPDPISGFFCALPKSPQARSEAA